MDVDGVLTDGTVLLDEAGRESKRISFADIMGVSLGRRAGLQFALVSGESGPTLDRIAEKLGIDEVDRGCRDKASALRAFAERHALNLDEICFIGDDINDVAALQISGLAAVPATAQPVAIAQASIVTVRAGGSGSVREVVDRILGTRE